MKNTSVAWIVMLVLGLAVPAAQADQFEINPSLTVRGEYNDNIFFNSEDEVDDYILTIKPGIELIQRTERFEGILSGEVAPFFYADNSDLDDTDQDYRGRVSYQFAPRFTGRADAFFIVDNRPDRDILTTGLVQSNDQRDRYHFGGGANYLLSEKAAVDLSYDWNKDDWESEATDREDLTANVGNIGFLYNLTGWLEASTGRLNFGYANYDYEKSKTDSFYGGVGLDHMFSEVLTLEVDLGARYVHSKFDVNKLVPIAPGLPFFRSVTETETNSGWGAVGQAALEYRGEKTRNILLISRDLAATSGRTGPTDRFRIFFSVFHRIFEDLRFGLTAGFYRNKADEGDFSSVGTDEDTYRIRPSIRWEFYENLTFEGAYTYAYVDDRENNSNTSQNRVFLQIGYGLPLFDFIDIFSAEGRQIVSGAVPPVEQR